MPGEGPEDAAGGKRRACGDNPRRLSIARSRPGDLTILDLLQAAIAERDAEDIPPEVVEDQSLYERTKWRVHYEVAAPMISGGLPLAIVLPGLVYGPGCSTPLRDGLRLYLRGRLIGTPRSSAMCWSHVEDVAEGHVLAMERGRAGEPYILAGPAHTFQAAFALAEAITGIRAPRFHPSPWLVRLVAALMRPVQAVFPVPAAFTAQNLRMLAGATFLASSAKARRELGWTARSLAEGLRETLDHERRALASGSAV